MSVQQLLNIQITSVICLLLLISGVFSSCSDPIMVSANLSLSNSQSGTIPSTIPSQPSTPSFFTPESCTIHIILKNSTTGSIQSSLYSYILFPGETRLLLDVTARQGQQGKIVSFVINCTGKYYRVSFQTLPLPVYQVSQPLQAYECIIELKGDNTGVLFASISYENSLWIRLFPLDLVKGSIEVEQEALNCILS